MILVVVENQNIAQTLNFLLSSTYRLEIAPDIETALQRVDVAEYDLIVVDVLLEQGSGIDLYQLYQQLRAKGIQTPILLLVDQAGEHPKAFARNAGADDYVLKPLDPEELLQRVQTLLSRSEVVKQLERERIVAEITNSIRQTLDLKQVLQRTVEAVRELILIDRVIIFRFEPNWQGQVVAESVAPDCTALLSSTLYDPCFSDRDLEAFRQGQVSMIVDLDAGGCDDFYADLLRNLQVKANLVVPVLQRTQGQRTQPDATENPEDQLWGLLVAHHRGSSRQWQSEEIEFLQQLSNQFGIAIQQAELFEQTRSELQERLRSEQKIRDLQGQFYRAQRLESLGSLASGIAHDLNNVLTPILALTQLVQERLPDLDPLSRQMLETVDMSAQRGASLVKQILTFAQETDLERIDLQVEYLLSEVANVVEQTFPKSIEVRKSIPTQSLKLVSAEPTQLYQVFINLCVNARDAMPNGGVLTLVAENIYIDQVFVQMSPDAQVGDYLVVTVSDTGVGISPELRDRIFERFFTTKGSMGSGLGLSTALEIVSNHDGFMQVFSENGKGSDFKVYLPISHGTAVEEPLLEKLIAGNGELVLLVDDDLAVQHTNQSVLENYQYKILVANDGIEALSLYAKNQDEIRAVVINIMLPNLDGITTLRTFKKMNPNVKIIAMSGLLSNKEPALAAGATMFLSKPYVARDLLRNLNTLINKRY